MSVRIALMDNENKSPEKLSSSESSKDTSNSKDDDTTTENSEKKNSVSSKETKKTDETKNEKRARFFEREEKKEQKISPDSPVSENHPLLKDDKKTQDNNLESKSDKSETNEDSEAEEGLTENEAQDVASAIIDTRNEELADELESVVEDSPKELEVLADIAFLESLREHIDSGEELTEEVIDIAFDETAEDLGVEDTHYDDESSENNDVNQESILSNDNENDNFSADFEIEPDQSVENPDSTLTPPTPIKPPVPPVPPVPPTPPRPPVPPTSPSSSIPPLPPNPNNPNRYQYNPPSPNNNQNTVVHYVERRRRGRDLLVGGIVGYVIGRRGGRKRTEKKLIPKIEKLEKEVATLHDVITEREDKIRKMARASAETDYKLKLSEEKNHSKHNEKTNGASSKPKAVSLVENRQKRIEIKQTLKRREELASKESVEKLSKFTLPALEVFKERRLMDGSENSPKRKRFEDMTDAELLEKVKGVEVDGISIEQAYRKGRIDHTTLLEITKSYYRSDSFDFKQVLRKEIKSSPEELVNHRQKVEQLREKQNEETNAEYLNSKVTEDLDIGNASDEEKQRFFQINADSTQQVAPRKKLTKSTTVLPWIAVVVVMALLAVGYLIIG